MGRKFRIIIIAVIILAAAVLTAGLALQEAGAGDPGWHQSFTGSEYYIDDDGHLARGYQMIDSRPYYFDILGRPCKRGWIEAKGHIAGKFFCEGGGELATGWKYTDSKAWYFYQNDDERGSKPVGAAASDYTTAGGIYIDERGYIDGEEGEAIGYGIDVLNRFGWSLEEAYKYSAALEYADGRSDDYGLTVHSCAHHGFKYGEGNCLAWAGTFCVMARLLGYDCRMVWGTLEFRGEDVTHSWDEIWENDTPHIYDPRRNGGQGMGGFDKLYGEKGTYKYNLDSRTYLEW
jgi:hypothetical protein